MYFKLRLLVRPKAKGQKALCFLLISRIGECRYEIELLIYTELENESS